MARWSVEAVDKTVADSIAYSSGSSPSGWWPAGRPHTAVGSAADSRTAMVFDSRTSAWPADCTDFVGRRSGWLSNRSAVEDDSGLVEVRSVGRMAAVGRTVADN